MVARRGGSGGERFLALLSGEGRVRGENMSSKRARRVRADRRTARALALVRLTGWAGGTVALFRTEFVLPCAHRQLMAVRSAQRGTARTKEKNSKKNERGETSSWQAAADSNPARGPLEQLLPTPQGPYLHSSTDPRAVSPDRRTRNYLGCSTGALDQTTIKCHRGIFVYYSFYNYYY